ncbi:hypothetical protein ACFDTO_20845 [Microbacteriaceae bacterium 4G12]
MLETATIDLKRPRQTSTIKQTIPGGEIFTATRGAATSVANTGFDLESITRSSADSDLSTQSRSRPVGRRALPTTFRVSDISTWTGRVVDVDDDIFTAELTPDERTPGAIVLADFARGLVVDVDEPLQVGDVVYVTTRMVRAPHGGRSETSSVRLRRLGKWTAEDVSRLSARADEFASTVASLSD